MTDYSLTALSMLTAFSPLIPLTKPLGALAWRPKRAALGHGLV